MADFEVLAPGGHQHLVDKIKEWSRADDSVDTDQIVDGAVTGDKIADDAVTDAMLAPDGIKPQVGQLWGNQLTGELTGDILTATDAYAAPLMALTVDGASTQVTTTGKNLLLDVLPDNTINATMSNAISAATNARVFAIPCELNTGYVFSCNTNGTISHIGFGDKLPAIGDTVYEAASMANRKNWTANSGEHPYILVNVTSVASFELIPSREGQIEKGSTATAYEPYTGGKPSPNPDYAQPILSVDECALELRGKNLCGGEALRATLTALPNASSGSDSYGNYVRVGASALSSKPLYGCPFKPNMQYTLIQRLAKSSGNTNANIRVNYTNGTYEHILMPTDFAADVPYTIVTVTAAGKTVESITGVNASVGTVFYYYQCGIFEGVATAADFAPYVSTTVPIYDGTLRSLPNGTKDTLSLAYLRPSTREGWAWYSREVTRAVGHVSDFGTFTWERTKGAASSETAWKWRTVLPDVLPSAFGKTNKMCNAYACEGGTGESNVIPNNTIAQRSNYKMIYIREDGYMYVTSTEWAEHVTGVQYDYVLEVPVTATLDPIELPALPAPNCTVWCDPTTGLALGYVRDTGIALEMAVDEAKGTDIAASLAPVASNPSASNYAKNAFLMLDGQLCKVTTPIASGETIAIGTNVAATTVAAEIMALQ